MKANKPIDLDDPDVVAASKIAILTNKGSIIIELPKPYIYILDRTWPITSRALAEMALCEAIAWSEKAKIVCNIKHDAILP